MENVIPYGAQLKMIPFSKFAPLVKSSKYIYILTLMDKAAIELLDTMNHINAVVITFVCILTCVS